MHTPLHEPIRNLGRSNPARERFIPSGLIHEIRRRPVLVNVFNSLLCPPYPAGLVRMRQRAKTAVQRQRQPVRDIIPLSLDEVEVSIVVLPSDEPGTSCASLLC
jgi:hypothetical protein